MAKHSADRPKGVVGETDPKKIKAEMDRIEREAAKEAEQAKKGK